MHTQVAFSLQKVSSLTSFSEPTAASDQGGGACLCPLLPGVFSVGINLKPGSFSVPCVLLRPLESFTWNLTSFCTMCAESLSYIFKLPLSFWKSDVSPASSTNTDRERESCRSSGPGKMSPTLGGSWENLITESLGTSLFSPTVSSARLFSFFLSYFSKIHRIKF